MSKSNVASKQWDDWRSPQERFELAIEALGKPFYRSENCAIYNGDCIDLMSSIPRRTFDLCVTSPPYNIGKEYERILPLEDYIEWSRNWIEKVHAVTSDHASFWLNLGYVPVEGKAKAMPLPYLLWDIIPFFLVQEVVWNYGAGVASKTSFSPRNEKFLWYVKDADQYVFNLDDVRDPDVKYPNQMKNGKLRCNPLGKNPSDVWSIPKVTSGTNRSSKERVAHPAQFPLAVIDRIVKASSNTGDLLLDPFLGSGSLAESALINNRRVIGFELRSDYAELAANRIEQFLQQPPLF